MKNLKKLIATILTITLAFGCIGSMSTFASESGFGSGLRDSSTACIDGYFGEGGGTRVPQSIRFSRLGSSSLGISGSGSLDSSLSSSDGSTLGNEGVDFGLGRASRSALQADEDILDVELELQEKMNKMEAEGTKSWWSVYLMQGIDRLIEDVDEFNSDARHFIPFNKILGTEEYRKIMELFNNIPEFPKEIKEKLFWQDERGNISQAFLWFALSMISSEKKSELPIISMLADRSYCSQLQRIVARLITTPMTPIYY